MLPYGNLVFQRLREYCHCYSCCSINGYFLPLIFEEIFEESVILSKVEYLFYLL